MKIENLKKLVLSLISLILIIFITKYLKIIGIIKTILTILIPLFIGLIYAWLFNPIITKLSNKLSRKLTSTLFFLFFISTFFIILYFTIPIIYKEVSEVIRILPSLFDYIESKVNNMGLNNYLDKLLIFLTDNVPLYLIDLVKNICKYTGIIAIGLILGLYISMDYNKIIKGIENIIPKKYKCIYINLTRDVSDNVRKCIHGTLLVALFVFITSSIVFYFIKLDAPLIFGAICGITDLIPYIGPYIGGIIAILVGFTKSTITGILTLISCIIIQAIENYILQPVIMSKTISISPVLIIISLLLFGNLFGIVGMIIAPPITATIKVFCIYIKEAIEKCS